MIIFLTIPILMKLYQQNLIWFVTKKHYKSLLGTLYIVALFCGSIIGGRLGDQLGRIRTYFLAQVLMTAIYLPMGYVQYYEAYATMYFFHAMITMISWVGISSYMAEIYTSKWRFVTYIIGAFPTYALVTSLILYLNRTYT